MATNGCTMTYNGVLKNTSLSLRAKGLYILIQSYIGIPGIELFKRKLAQSCADSYYSFKEAWNELRAAGYLKHYKIRSSRGGISQAYDLLDTPIPATENDICLRGDAAAQRLEQGLCQSIRHSGTGDFTTIPNAIVRSKDTSLSVKALYALVSHLQGIPGYVIRIKSIMNYCKERLKHFQSLWRSFKLSGLLKQHRFPCGHGANRFSYSYDLLDKKSLHTPYLTNYHADGSVSTTVTIQDYAQRLSDRMARTSIGRLARSIAAAGGESLKAKSKKAPHKTPPGKYPHIRDSYGQSSISRQHPPITTAQIDAVKSDIMYDNFLMENREQRPLLDTIVTAIAEMRYQPQVRIGSAEYSQIDIATYVDDIDDACVMDLLAMITDGRIDLSKIRNIKGYIQATLLNMCRDMAAVISNDLI